MACIHWESDLAMRELGTTVTLSSRSLHSMYSCFVRPDSETSASRRLARVGSIRNAAVTDRARSQGRFALRLRAIAHQPVDARGDGRLRVRHEVDVAVRHRLARVPQATGD